MNRLQEYRKAALRRAIERIPGEVLNDGLEYANILIESMIGLCGSNDDVFIYSGALPRESYEVALKVTPANSISIIVDDDRNIQWLSSLSQQTLERISLHKIRRARPNHFFFTSSGAYRIEREPYTFKADGDFNNPGAVEQLQKAFSVLLSDSDDVATPASQMTTDTTITGT